MTQLAKEFALSDVALHKICRRHGIPTPPVGWWAKQAAGKPVKRLPLPTGTGDAPEIVIAGADLTATDAALVEAREQARILASTGQIRSAAAMHPAIGRTLAALRKAKPSSQGLVSVEGANLIRCTVAPTSFDRLADFLPGLLGAAAVQGFGLEAAETGALFRSATETITVSITEALDRTRHEMTDAEKAKQAAWQKKRDEAVRRNSWSFLVHDRPVVPEWDYAPSGRLGLEFEQVYTRARVAPRRTFKDGKTQKLEAMVSDIAVGLAVLAAAKTQMRLEHEARQRAWQEEQARRERAARDARREAQRHAALEAILADLDSLDRLRRLMANLRAEYADRPSPRLKNFLVWAGEATDQRAAALSTAALENRFAAEDLFGDNEDQDDVRPR